MAPPSAPRCRGRGAGYVFNGGVASICRSRSGAPSRSTWVAILVGGSVLSGALEYILGSGSNIVVSGAGALMQMYGAADVEPRSAAAASKW